MSRGKFLSRYGKFPIGGAMKITKIKSLDYVIILSKVIAHSSGKVSKLVWHVVHVLWKVS